MTAPYFAVLLVLGFVRGLEHALEPDHVVAVSTMVTRTGSLKKSWQLGASWGVGHAVALLVAGMILQVFQWALPVRVALSFEFLVGCVLVLLGVDAVIKAMKHEGHLHSHHHGDAPHIHFHSHRVALHHDHIHQSFIVGMMHGLAGSGSLILVVAATLHSPWRALLYIVLFGAGAIAGMMTVSAMMGVTFALTGKLEKMQQKIQVLAAVCSIFIGFTIMYGIAAASV